MGQRSTHPEGPGVDRAGWHMDDVSAAPSTRRALCQHQPPPPSRLLTDAPCSPHCSSGTPAPSTSCEAHLSLPVLPSSKERACQLLTPTPQRGTPAQPTHWPRREELGSGSSQLPSAEATVHPSAMGPSTGPGTLRAQPPAEVLGPGPESDSVLDTGLRSPFNPTCLKGQCLSIIQRILRLIPALCSTPRG